MDSETCCCERTTMNTLKHPHYSAEMLVLAAQKARLAALNRVPGRLQALVAEKAARKGRG